MRTTHPTDEHDPWATLGLEPGAPEEAARAAYLAAVREHPPDRDPEGFERVRDAYAAVRATGRGRGRFLSGADPAAPLASLIGGTGAERRFVGPEPWLAALAERQGGRR